MAAPLGTGTRTEEPGQEKQVGTPAASPRGSLLARQRVNLHLPAG